MENFSTFLNRKCKKNENSIRKIATLSEISHSYLLDLMKGRKNPPDIKTQINIAKALDLKIDEKIKFFDFAAKERRRSSCRYLLFFIKR